MKDIIQAYMLLPKVVRFVLYYGTAPIWFPVITTFCLLVLVFLAPIVWTMDAWDNFK